MPHDFEQGQEHATVGHTEIEGVKVDGLQALLVTMEKRLLRTLKKMLEHLWHHMNQHSAQITACVLLATPL